MYPPKTGDRATMFSAMGVMEQNDSIKNCSWILARLSAISFSGAPNHAMDTAAQKGAL